MDEILASIRRIIETGEDRSGAAAANPLRPLVSGFTSGFASREAERVQAAASPPYGGAEPEPEAVAGQESLSTEREPDEAQETAPAGFSADADVASGGKSPIDGEASIVPIGESADDDPLTAQLESELAASWDRTEPDSPSPGGRDESVEPMPEPAEARDEIDHRPDADAPEAPEAQASADTPAVFKAAEPLLPPLAPIAGAPDLRRLSEASAVLDRGPADAPTAAPDLQRSEFASMERNPFQPANTDRRPLPAAEERSMPGSGPFGEPPLASDATGSLVAASFDELAQAIRKGELRSLETMAQDMLRPMLQDWLDDNLPRMVERLVREEIERMSRGGRR